TILWSFLCLGFVQFSPPQKTKHDWVAIIPALFITCVCGTYLGYAPILLNLSLGTAQILGGCITACIFGLYLYHTRKA
ncbi:MAG: hypothetical protein SPL08_04460, partial [Pseudomonadota bacterium]|nr:hypothetical protein [Pseudomonadota bacterium]